MSVLATKGSRVLAPCWSWQPFVLPKYSLSPNSPVVLLLTLMYSLPSVLLKFSLFLPSLLLALKCQRLPSGLCLISWAVCCAGIFWNFRIFCLNYLKITSSVWSPTNILDSHTSSGTLCSPCISFCSFSNLCFTFVILSCPFSISWALHLIRNFSVSNSHYFFLFFFFPYFLLFFIQLFPVCFVLQTFLAFLICLSFVSLSPFLPFPGLPQYTPQYLPSNLERGEAWYNFLCKSKHWEVGY